MAYEVNGIKCMSIPETAKRWGKSVTFVKARIKAGMIPYVMAKPKHGALESIPVVAVDQPCPPHDPEKKKWLNRAEPLKSTEPEPTAGNFPALHRNAEGIVAPAKIDKEAPEVSCADCPHQVDKAHKCYGLARYDNGETGEGFYGCHRIGRKVHPLKEWTRKSDYQPTPTGVQERENEVPVICIEKPAPLHEEPKKSVLPVPDNQDKDLFKQAIIRLEAFASEMQAEAEELEGRFELLSEQLSEVMKASGALEKIREFGRR